MKRLLIVSPHFPPVDAVDMHRVRHGVNFYREHGWEPTVLCVDPDETGRLTVPELLKTIPEDLEVHAVQPMPLRIMERIGVRALGIRSFLSMYRAGNDLLRRTKFDLIFFSTTAFPLMPLGRLWRRKFGVPYVLDIQDPWASDYKGEGRRKGGKHALMRAVHRKLEKWTAPSASGIIAVSDGYVEALRERYPSLKACPARAIPFGLLPRDFAVAEHSPLPALLESTKRTGLRGVYMGALDGAMKPALRVLLKAWRLGAEAHGEPFSGMQMFFVGTSYANGDLANETLMPLARDLGVQNVCFEQAVRVPYFQALNAMRSADFLILPIRDAGGYVPSKLFSLLFLEKPIVAIAPADSPLVPFLKDLPSVALARFPNCDKDRHALAEFVGCWRKLLLQPDDIRFDSQRQLLEQYLARNVARAECAVFEQAALHRS